jgi:nitrogen fixation/metabolism regulation signal transduction histidine kinase
MKLRTKYILFVTILHTVALITTWFIFRENRVFFIVSEVFIIISALIAWQLYNQLIQPLKMLQQGTEAIKDRDFNVKFLETGKYEMDQLIRVYNQMIDQLRTERTKQEQQHFFLEKLIYTSPTGIIILDYDDNIKQINPQALQLLSLTEKEVLDRSIKTVAHPVLQAIELLRPGESKTITFNGITTYKLQKSHFIDRGFARHFIMIEELTAEIMAAEKKAYGKVIRMMAHEVNNTIGPVNSILQSTLQKDALWNGADTARIQDALQVAINRNQNLNVFMRNFADVVRLPAPNKKNINLKAVLKAVAGLLEIKIAEKQIVFDFCFDETPFYIHADEQQMEQVFINIVKNALEAIGHGGIISFTIHINPGQVIIADTGKGIKEDIADDLFSPFFSTKRDGQGIGLTLAKEILMNHGFTFSLKTYGAADTRFIIYFD